MVMHISLSIIVSSKCLLNLVTVKNVLEHEIIIDRNSGTQFVLLFVISSENETTRIMLHSIFHENVRWYLDF